MTVGAQGEIGELKSTINVMVDQLSLFIAEMTRLARGLGRESKLGAQMDVPGAEGTWRDLISNVNQMSRF